VRLSIRYGIVTPYTSYLVTEDMALGAAAQEEIAQQAFNQINAAPAEVSGQDAVRKAADEGAMAGAESVQAPPAEAANVVRVVGSHTFVFTNNTWTDTAYDPDRMQTVKVPFLSEDYFSLAQASAEVGAAFALGERVIVLSDGVAYEVVGADEPAPPVELPATQVPAPNDVDPVATPIAVSQAETPASPTETPANSILPTRQPASPKFSVCGVGLLPLGLVMVGWITARRKK
jgi:Ca-activated chloride channel family protein